MKTRSLWGKPPKRIYNFIDIVKKRTHDMGEVCVVGASDGKFVLPMLRSGLNVVAIEIDDVAIYGGEKIIPLPRMCIEKLDYESIDKTKEFPELPCKKIPIIGLIDRVKKEKLENCFELIKMDFYHNLLDRKFDAVFTSCSIQYKINRDLSLEMVLKHLQDIVNTGGLLYMDYMMPLEDSHNWKSELFLRSGQIKNFFKEGWNILYLKEYKKPMFEAAHIDRPRDHFHRFGFILVEKLFE